MRFFTFFEGEPGEGRIAVTLNLEHVVRVVFHEDGALVVHTSDGKSHVVAHDNIREFRMLLQQLSQPNPK